METIHLNHVLAPYVRRIWTTGNFDIAKSYSTYRFFADGCPGVMFQECADGMFLNDEKKLSTLFLYGQTVKPIAISAGGGHRIIVVFFYPHVVKALLGIDAHELTDTCLDLGLDPLGRQERIVERLVNTPSDPERIELIKQFLVKMILSNGRQLDPEIQMAVSKFSQPDHARNICQIRETLNMSERTLLRKFESQVGVSPKVFSNICRFRRSFDKLESGKYDKLADIAFESGYADQSHFIRSFKEFAGETPRSFLKMST
jgi:AraC-like DNA-binding protein